MERALFKHQAVREAAVVGIPSSQWGEAVHAIIVLHEGAKVSSDELLAHCRKLIGGYKCPRSVDFTDQLPREPNGKLYKRLLRERYWAGHGSLVI